MDAEFEADMLINNKDKVESTEVSRQFEGKKGLDEFKKTALYIDAENMEKMVKMRGTFVNDLVKANLSEQTEILERKDTLPTPELKKLNSYSQ